MSNLIPEKRVDKNGRLVTKHIKAGDAAGTNMSSVPAPSLPENQRERQVSLIAEPLRKERNKGTFSSCSKLLRTYQDTTLSAASYEIENGTPFASEIIAKAVVKRNEGFLLLVASSSRVWSGVVESRLNKETGSLDDTIAHSIVGKMWDAYEDMTDNDTTVLYETLDHVAAEDFSPEESIETFQLEYLGKVLELDIHTRTKRDYYRNIEKLGEDIEGVGAAMPVLMGINKGLILMDRDGYDVSTSLKSDQVMSVVQLSKTYPERMSSLVDFIKQRHTYDDDAVREFLETDATALSSGIL